MSKENNPMIKLSKRLRQTLKTQSTPCIKCGRTHDVQMHHVKATKRIKTTDRLERHIKMINILQVALCKTHHLEATVGSIRKLGKSSMKPSSVGEPGDGQLSR